MTRYITFDRHGKQVLVDEKGWPVPAEKTAAAAAHVTCVDCKAAAPLNETGRCVYCARRFDRAEGP